MSTTNHGPDSDAHGEEDDGHDSKEQRRPTNVESPRKATLRGTPTTNGTIYTAIQSPPRWSVWAHRRSAPLSRKSQGPRDAGAPQPPHDSAGDQCTGQRQHAVRDVKVPREDGARIGARCCIHHAPAGSWEAEGRDQGGGGTPLTRRAEGLPPTMMIAASSTPEDRIAALPGGMGWGLSSASEPNGTSAGA